MYDIIEFNDLLGKILKSIHNERNEELWFYTVDGFAYKMYHAQDCCESVYIEDICGDLDDLVGAPILMAEEAVSYETPEDLETLERHGDSSQTWTFYKLATIKGYVTIRWYGTSNGYYSESVNFVKLDNPTYYPHY